jgi:hypothetical protein
MINLPTYPDIKNIPVAVKQLTDMKVNIKKLINVNLLNKINHQQFVFLMGIAAYSGEDFLFNMGLIKKYINKIEMSDLEVILTIENNLHNVFLKKYETEQSYNIFYNFFSQIHLYKNKNDKLVVSSSIKNILFYTHGPTFLAHTNPMFKMLKNRVNKSINVSIATYGFNEEFKNKCKSLGVEYYNIFEKNIFKSFENLKNLSKNNDRIIWVSLPLHLSYFRSICNNVCLWSLKFHPNITNLKKYIGTFNNTETAEIIFNRNTWKNINLGFDINNLKETEVSWKVRKLKFGSFCREELIDSKNYWETVKIILEENPTSKFYYCGRNEIHLKWSEKLDINIHNVIFLNWLEKPHLKLKEMSFILDGFTLGHGLMGIEAMAASVPVIFPQSRRGHGTSENFIKRSANFLNIENKQKYHQSYLLSFDKNSSLIQLSKKLLTDYKYNNFFGSHYKKIIEQYPSGAFEDFIEVLN